MCATCEKAKLLPVKQALELIGKQMQRGSRDCLDALIGKLVGVDETKQVDRARDAAWERSRR